MKKTLLVIAFMATLIGCQKKENVVPTQPVTPTERVYIVDLFCTKIDNPNWTIDSIAMWYQTCNTLLYPNDNSNIYKMKTEYEYIGGDCYKILNWKDTACGTKPYAGCFRQEAIVFYIEKGDTLWSDNGNRHHYYHH